MKKILLVDDEELILWGLTKTILSLGNSDKEIRAVDNGRDAHSEINSSSFDLCFLDIHIPDGDGLDLMRRVKQLSPGTKVVVMTSHDLDDNTKKEIQESAYHFVSKPFDLLQVREIVESALGDDSPPILSAESITQD